MIAVPSLKINSARTINELNTFIVKDSGKPEAEKHRHDDLVMSLAMLVYVWKQLYDGEPLAFLSTVEPKKDAKEKVKRETLYKGLVDVNGNTTEYEEITWLLTN